MHDEENRACDKNMLIGDDVKCTCGNTVLHNYADGEIQNPEQKEEWEEEYITLLGTLMEISAFSAYLGSFHHGKIKDFIRTQISLAEERGRMEAIECVDVLFETLETANAIGSENLKEIVSNQCANYRKLTQKS